MSMVTLNFIFKINELSAELNIWKVSHSSIEKENKYLKQLNTCKFGFLVGYVVLKC